MSDPALRAKRKTERLSARIDAATKRSLQVFALEIGAPMSNLIVAGLKDMLRHEQVDYRLIDQRPAAKRLKDLQRDRLKEYLDGLKNFDYQD